MRPLLESALSDQEIPTDTFNNLPLNWDKESDSFSEEVQRVLQIQAAHKLKVKIYHDTLGHCDDLLLTNSLKKLGVSVQHLLPYINSYNFNECTTNLGWLGHLLKTTTASITESKDTVTTPSQLTTSVIEPEPIIAPADFADSCQIGRTGDHWFLLMVDKTTEYVSLNNTKTRSNPLVLFKEYLYRRC